MEPPEVVNAWLDQVINTGIEEAERETADAEFERYLWERGEQ